MKINEAKAYQLLKAQIASDGYKRVVTIGRGGLAIAQKLAYHLDVPVVIVDNKQALVWLTPEDLFVDDIEDSSNTVLSVGPNVHRAVLVQKESSLGLADFVGLIVDTEEYITFSWEANYE